MQTEVAAKGSGAKIVVGRYQALGPQGVGIERYRGLGIFALPGLHAHCAELLQSVLPSGRQVLDLAAGSGAMSLRLADLGYQVTATDLVADNFQPVDRARFIAADLNEPFSEVFGRFDAVVAMEIIEHVENPRHFLRQCRACLRDGGYLVLSTPNLANPLSRVQFLLDGTHQWFHDDNYESIGHIMPVSPWLLRHCFQDCGFEPVQIGSFGDIRAGLKGWPRMRWLVNGLRPLSRIPGDLNGEIYTAVVRAV